MAPPLKAIAGLGCMLLTRKAVMEMVLGDRQGCHGDGVGGQRISIGVRIS